MKGMVIKMKDKSRSAAGWRVTAGRGVVMLMLLSVFICACSAALAKAKEAEEWSYDPDAGIGAEVWRTLFSSDEAFLDGVSYEPKALLASGGGMEAWLVTCGEQREEASGLLRPDGYLVLYIQLEPAPKVIGSYPVGAAPVKTEPACELRFLLDSSRVLDEAHLLREDIREAFGMEEEAQSIEVMYLETPGKDFQGEGWMNRIRVKDGKAKYTVTYKKRYAVPDDDLDAALAAAREDGFSLYDEQFPAEIDWGYSKMVLSFADDVDVKTESEEVPDLFQLSPDEAAEMAAAWMPSEIRDWGAAGWGTETLEAAQVVGPVRFLRYTGMMDDQEVRIEIWPMPADGAPEYLVEFSAQCKNVKKGARFREILLEELEQMNILVPGDSLKTERLLNGSDGAGDR